MSPRLPIIRNRILVDRLGRICVIEIRIEETTDQSKYPPDGKKCVFRLKREVQARGDVFNLILLIDNHEPFGFHWHDKLPNIHDSRKKIWATNWMEAWDIFDKKLKELINE